MAIQDGDKLTDALTFRLAVETGAAERLATLLAQTPPAPRPRRPARPPACGPPAPPGADDPRDVLLTRLAEVNAATPQDYRRLDTLFHLSIAELTGSSLLATACADARMRLNDLLNAIPVLRRNIDHTAGQHTAIVLAILAGEADAARIAVAEHLEGTAALLRAFLA
jgi:DNA-binding GntR family transcriptional regulator